MKRTKKVYAIKYFYKDDRTNELFGCTMLTFKYKKHKWNTVNEVDMCKTGFHFPNTYDIFSANNASYYDGYSSTCNLSRIGSTLEVYLIQIKGSFISHRDKICVESIKLIRRLKHIKSREDIIKKVNKLKEKYYMVYSDKFIEQHLEYGNIK